MAIDLFSPSVEECPTRDAKCRTAIRAAGQDGSAILDVRGSILADKALYDLCCTMPEVSRVWLKLASFEMARTYVLVVEHDGSSKEVLGTGYKYYKDNLVGSGKADIFQNGRYIRGAWYREKETSRLIFLDDEGNELKFQRGKSYIVVNSSNCVVSYDE